MANFKALEMYLRNTTRFKNLGKHLPLREDNVKFMAVIDYLGGVSDSFTKLKEFDSNLNDSIFKKIYPGKIGKLMTSKSQRQMKGWLEDIRVFVNRGDDSNEVKFLFLTLLIWHMAIKELYYPVLLIANNDSSRLFKIDFQVLGFRKPDIKMFELLIDVQDTNLDYFLDNKSVSDGELDRLVKYVNRLVRYQVGLEYVGNQ